MQRMSTLSRTLTSLAGAALLLGTLAGCGDDSDGGDEVSSEEAFCDAGDSLQSDIEGLGDIDLTAEGTDAVEAQVAAIEDDLKGLQESGSEVAADDIDALNTAVTDLDDQLAELGDSPSVAAASAAATSVQNIVESAGAVLDTLSTTCS